MSTDLMKPRYKVIAPFPQMHFIGEGGFSTDAIFYPEHKNEKYFYNGVNIDAYPHLFKKLQWFEERKPEDMPEYVKNLNETVFKVSHHFTSSFGEFTQYGCNVNNVFISYRSLSPATETEYHSFINQSKQQS